MSNLAIMVQHIYAAFGRRDISALLKCLSENVEWGGP
jgi:ketosteroid isomerase-like protein